MNFSDNLIVLRKRKGYSQEELANVLGVSRQSVSKWESGHSVPELERLLTIADVFEVSLDELVQRDATCSNTHSSLTREELRETVRRALGYEYKSKWNIAGLPLVHINIGRGLRVAKGVIAIGNIALGVLALGGVAFGAVGLGALCLALLAIGGASLGGFAVGGLSVGYVAIGGVAIGVYAIGGFAIAAKLAIGGLAHGYVAIGGSAKGTHTLITTADTNAQIIKNFISQQASINEFIIKILNFFI